MQIPPRTETRLVTECKHAADWHTRSIAACFHLSLLADERVEFSFCRFNFGPRNPAKFKQPIQQLPKEVESRIIVSSNDDLRTETTESVPNWRTCGNCREDGAHEILKEATKVSTEFFSEEATVFFHGAIADGSFRKMLLCDCPKTRMIREHVRLPLLYHGQIATSLQFL